MKKPTVPDWFSLYRFFAAPPIIHTLVKCRKHPFLMLSVVSLASDAIDGILARRLHQETARGAKLDSGGDLVTQLLMLAGLFRFQKGFVRANRGSLLSIGGVYALQMLVSYLKYGKLTTFHTHSSKVAFTAMGLFYMLLFVYKDVPAVYKTAVALMILSLVEDILLVFVLPRPRDNVKGLYWELRKRQ